MATTTTTQIPSGRTEHFDKVLLINAFPFLSHHLFGDVRPFPMRTGNQIKMRRYGTLAANTTALTEGVTPAGKQGSKTDVTATLQRYGDYITLSDDVVEENVESVKAEYSELLGQQAGDSADQIYRDAIVGGTTVKYANGTARTAVNTAIATDDIFSVVNTLTRNNAQLISKILKASTGVGTVPIAAGFFGICHPDVGYDLSQMTGWKYVHEYADPSQRINEHELGAFNKVRFIESTNGKIWTSAGGAKGSMRSDDGVNADVYATLIFAAHAYALVPLQAEGRKMNKTNILFITHGFDVEGGPLEQRMTMGWKFKTVAKITNDNFMARIESAATAL